MKGVQKGACPLHLRRLRGPSDSDSDSDSKEDYYTLRGGSEGGGAPFLIAKRQTIPWQLTLTRQDLMTKVFLRSSLHN